MVATQYGFNVICTQILCSSARHHKSIIGIFETGKGEKKKTLTEQHCARL